MWDSSFEDPSSDEDVPSSLRYRPGNRFVPSFSELVDRHVNLLWLNLTTGAVCWDQMANANMPALIGENVLVQIAYREEESQDATASTVWDSAVLLSRWLISHAGVVERFGQVVELGEIWVGGAMLVVQLNQQGAGTGLAGLVCSRINKRACVTLTDLPGCIKRLEANVALNKSTAKCSSLTWGESTFQLLERSAPCLVLAADCLLPYNPKLLIALANTIVFLLQSHQQSEALVAFEERCNVEEFFTSLKTLKWEVVESLDKDTIKIVFQSLRLKFFAQTSVQLSSRFVTHSHEAKHWIVAVTALQRQDLIFAHGMRVET